MKTLSCRSFYDTTEIGLEFNSDLRREKRARARTEIERCLARDAARGGTVDPRFWEKLEYFSSSIEKRNRSHVLF